MFAMVIDTEVLCGTIRIPVHDPKIKLTDL